ncbi:MAG: hypothetical protein LBU65_02435 [Planctomycetaceae bacterium]|nr:hypothetical protein [Planctomycetaceae bacterium]
MIFLESTDNMKLEKQYSTILTIFIPLLLCFATMFFVTNGAVFAQDYRLPVITPVLEGQVKVRSYSWVDELRHRVVPFLMYYPAETDSSCPVVFFSHGLGGSSRDSAYLGKVWAQAGIVSIHLQHIGSDETLNKGVRLRTYFDMRDAYSQHWSGRDRARDIKFVLDYLTELSRNNPQIGDVLDLDRVGVSGFNLGALASLLLAGQSPPDGRVSLKDERFKAVIALGTPLNSYNQSYRTVYEKITIPCLFINGSEDNSIIGSTTAQQRRIPFDALTANDHYLVTLAGAGHSSYTYTPLPFTTPDSSYYNVIAKLTVSFWQAQLGIDEQAKNAWQDKNWRPQIGRAGTFERRLKPVVILEPEPTVDEPTM